MSLSSWLYKMARFSRDVKAIERTAETGNPTYIARRAKNRLLGRALARAGFFRWLWK